MRWLCALLVLAAGLASAEEPYPLSEEQLVRDVKALLADDNPRPSHVNPPLPGSFGELADPYLRLLQVCWTEQREYDETKSLRRAILHGDRPADDLPPAWRSELSKCGPAADGLLKATRAGFGRLPFPLTVFGEFAPEPQPYGESAVLRGAEMAAFEILEATGAGDTARALSSCADALALARDVGRPAMLGAMIGGAVVRDVEPACLRALRKAKVSERSQFAAQVAVIASALAEPASLFDGERLFSEIGPVYETLSPATQVALPPEAHLKTERESQTRLGALRLFVFGSWARRVHARNLLALAKAVRLAPRDADAAIERIDQAFPLSVSLAIGDEWRDMKWIGFVRTERTTRARLDRLRYAALLYDDRDEHGRWPTSWAEMGIDPPVDPRSGLAIALRPLPGGMAIEPVLDGPRTTDDLSLLLH